jgi:hypothetical protein
MGRRVVGMGVGYNCELFTANPVVGIHPESQFGKMKRLVFIMKSEL